MSLREHILSRVSGSLAGAVIGDALGAPTEARSIAGIHRTFGGPVREFIAPPADSAYAAGRAAGQVTDDASQLLLLAEMLVATKGRFTSADMAGMLLRWSEIPDFYPQLAGPTTRRAIAALQEGADPETLGAGGTDATTGASNGAAMRVAPVGLCYPGDVESAVKYAAITCRPSHFTSIGVSGAAAVAAAVAAAMLPTASVVDVVRAAMTAAEAGHAFGAEHGRDVPGPLVAKRMELAVHIASASRSLDEAVVDIAAYIGTGLHTSEAVPAALGMFVAAGGDPWLTAYAAANSGDDTDTVGCMAAAIAGAYAGIEVIPAEKVAFVEQANDVVFAELAEGLTEIALANWPEPS